MGESLEYSPVTHAHLKPVVHPRLDATINSRTAVRYLRFLRPVRIDRLKLTPHVYGRWQPRVPVHPAHLVISTLDASSHTWEVVTEAELELDPRIRGKGLSQDMPIEEMEAHFKDAVDDPLVHVIDLQGLETDLLRVECDREHPVWPNHGETNGNRFQVPFGTLDTLEALGEPLDPDMPVPEPQPVLGQGTVEPAAPEGMKCYRHGESIIYEGPHLSIGFALRRPTIMHLGWDVLGEGKAGENRIALRRPRCFEPEFNHGMSGPLLVGARGDYGCQQWSGSVEIVGNRVRYRVQSVPRVWVDATFHVEPRRVVLELTQSAERDLPMLEAEAWRFVWGLERGMTGVAAAPTLRPGRAGDVELPAMFAGDGTGCLSCHLLEGDPDLVNLQAESYRLTSEVSAGVRLGERREPEGCPVVPKGEVSATIELAVDNLQPLGAGHDDEVGTGVRRHWASSFSCYRPEWAGFSNHAASVNCHVNQHAQIEVAASTAKPDIDFDPLDTARFTIRRALLDGSGYGYWRNLYMDADPVLVSAAGRIFQADRDPAWLRSVEPGLVEATQRLLDSIGEEGLAICRDLSGNTGSHRWSSNAWDVVGFGHMDAYSNAWTYRALRNAAVLLKELDRQELAERSRQAAAGLKTAFAPNLVNPETGWVVGWRSRDGELHDYAYLWINGVACAFGLLEPQMARTALGNLEDLRDELGLSSGRLGLPFNLLPLEPGDHIMPTRDEYHWTEPTFERFTDGSMSPSAVTYYLRALSIHGLDDRAAALAADLDAGFADGLFTGGSATGTEFLSWEGLPSGYEGTFGPTMGALYGVAIEQGLFEPPEPEWWPSEE